MVSSYNKYVYQTQLFVCLDFIINKERFFVNIRNRTEYKKYEKMEKKGSQVPRVPGIRKEKK